MVPLLIFVARRERATFSGHTIRITPKPTKADHPMSLREFKVSYLDLSYETFDVLIEKHASDNDFFLDDE